MCYDYVYVHVISIECDWDCHNRSMTQNNTARTKKQRMAYEFKSTNVRVLTIYRELNVIKLLCE